MPVVPVAGRSTGETRIRKESIEKHIRKDFLLQKNGCLVLRFLAEDVTTWLAQVVDEISAEFVMSASRIFGIIPSS